MSQSEAYEKKKLYYKNLATNGKEILKNNYTENMRYKISEKYITVKLRTNNGVIMNPFKDTFDLLKMVIALIGYEKSTNNIEDDFENNINNNPYNYLKIGEDRILKGLNNSRFSNKLNFINKIRFLEETSDLWKISGISRREIRRLYLVNWEREGKAIIPINTNVIINQISLIIKESNFNETIRMKIKEKCDFIKTNNNFLENCLCKKILISHIKYILDDSVFAGYIDEKPKGMKLNNNFGKCITSCY